MVSISLKSAGNSSRKREDSYEQKAKFWDDFASTFDACALENRWTAPRRMVSALGSDINGSLDVLDAGCGTGLVGELVRGNGCLVDGIDFSDEMLKLANERSIYRHLRKIDLSRQYHLEASYPLVVSVGVFGYPLDVSCITYTLDHCKPGGIVAVAGEFVHEKMQMRDILHRRGFDLCREFIDYAQIGPDGAIDYVYLIAEKVRFGMYSKRH
ncbi:methyltransferase domain-containing protein [Candidatus Woesearchaeota archaeon]|nr:methyltransferase domain-containing protein [Candidatus Woesearchaeota archaeon]HIH37373.1 methyltransferase domain-containing protein [Candidatus Woesearchaeota archaeon]HIH48618.1 methyltransferase domain-containing protein [Candidatus Woesearchaeota archaeon]HIJ03602.1 methyltransferase domain-containing protein [Candidatus Woesearchaeota archaeon]